MRASTQFIRLLIRKIGDSAANTAAFVAALKVIAYNAVIAVQKGKVLIGTGSGGTTAQFTLPSIGSLTAEDLGEVCSLILDAVDRLLAEDEDIAKDDLVAALLEQFAAVYSTRPDFTALQR